MASIRLAFALTWILISFLTSSLSIQAQTTENTDSGGEGRPPHREDGGDRGGCQTVKTFVNKSLIALVPEKGEALITAESPTLLFYVPFVSTPTLYARFSLRDQNDYDVIDPPIKVELSATPAVISLHLPKLLDKAKLYHWSFAIICKPNNQAKNIVVDGWIRRIDLIPDLANQLNNKPSQRKLAALYVQKGLWLDALAILSEIRYTDPLADTDWTKLLTSMGFKEIAADKIVQVYCQINTCK